MRFLFISVGQQTLCSSYRTAQLHHFPRPKMLQPLTGGIIQPHTMPKELSSCPVLTQEQVTKLKDTHGGGNPIPVQEANYIRQRSYWHWYQRSNGEGRQGTRSEKNYEGHHETQQRRTSQGNIIKTRLHGGTARTTKDHWKYVVIVIVSGSVRTVVICVLTVLCCL